MASGSVATFPRGAGTRVEKAGGKGYSAHSMPHLLHQQLFIKSKQSFFLCCCWHNFLLHLLMLWWTCRPLHRLLFYPCLLCSCFGKREWWVEKASFPISHSWQAVWLRIDARCWLSVGVGGTRDRDRWWHAGVCQLKTAVAWMRRNAFLISKACFHLL